MRYQPVLEDGEADMQSVGSPGVLNVHGRLNLEAKIQIEVTTTVQVSVAPVVVSRWP